MRRNNNLRKKNSNKIQVLSKQNLILILVLFFLIIICILFNNVLNKSFNSVQAFAEFNQNFVNLNSNIPFSVDKIILYSNATANAKTINFSFANLDISQYCDIGIYLKQLDANSDISIKSLYINDISIIKPQVGTAYLYRKKVTDLGKASFSDSLIVDGQINFNVVNSKDVNYDNYELLSDASSPISIGYYNKNIKENYIAYVDNLAFDGTLLKDALIPTSDLSSKVSFTLNIIANDDEHYICNISFDIPLEDENGTLYDNGYITKQINEEHISKFIRIK